MLNSDNTSDIKLNRLPSYKYTDLPNKQSFRVLELLPGTPDEPISVRLHLASWNLPPNYDALSYSWGDPNLKVPVLCDGKRLECTPNLRLLLEALRPPVELRKRWPLKARRIIPASKLLWADALCIDQSNSKERGHQVSNMARIYRNAGTVRVWLGPEHTEGDAKAVMESVRVLSNRIFRALHTEFSAFDLDSNIYGHFWTNRRILPNPKSLPPEVVQYLKRLFSCPWFSRLWVIQEVNSNANCWVHFGNDKVEWIRVFTVACFIRLQEPGFDDQFRDTFCFHAKTIGTAFRPSIETVANYLVDASRFHCTDSRDKIFGLLGIIQTNFPTFPLEADYEKPILEVYTDVTEVFLSKAEVFNPNRPPLHILSFAMFDPSSDWPSWIIRWDRQVPKRLPQSNKISVHAVPNSIVAPVIDRKNKTLELRGLVLDAINTTTPIDGQLVVASKYSTDSEGIRAFWDHFLTRISTLREGQDPLTASAMALTCGTDELSESAEEEQLCNNFKAYLQEISQKNISPHGVILTKKASNFRYALWQNASAGDKERRRCYFDTETGFIGCTRQVPKPGDLVCILFGGGYPFILRPHRDGYLLFDHAYVYGAMGREITDDWNAGKLPHVQERTFKIY